MRHQQLNKTNLSMEGKLPMSNTNDDTTADPTAAAARRAELEAALESPDDEVFNDALEELSEMDAIEDAAFEKEHGPVWGPGRDITTFEGFANGGVTARFQ